MGLETHYWNKEKEKDYSNFVIWEENWSSLLNAGKKTDVTMHNGVSLQGGMETTGNPLNFDQGPEFPLSGGKRSSMRTKA